MLAFINLAWRLMGPGGNAAPVAAFTADLTTLQEPTSMTVQFTDQSTNTPTSWLWDFGDGTTSTAQNPSKTYTAAGTYTVTLTATNAGGSDAETKTGYITVNPWYKVDSITAVGAYRAKGAASYAASKVNLPNPGVNNLAEGNGVVLWDATNGWQLTRAESKYLTTGIVPQKTWSALVRFAGAESGITGFIFGTDTSAGGGASFSVLRTSGGPIQYRNWATLTGTNYAVGVAGITPTDGYKDGIDDGDIVQTQTGIAPTIYIGCVNNAGVPAFFLTVNIQAIVFFNQALTPTQVATMATRMAAL